MIDVAWVAPLPTLDEASHLPGMFGVVAVVSVRVRGDPDIERRERVNCDW